MLCVFGRVRCDISAAEAARSNAAIETALNRVASAEGVEHLHPAKVLCVGGRCDTRRGDTILYADRGHLTVAGSRVVVEGLGLRARIVSGR